MYDVYNYKISLLQNYVILVYIYSCAKNIYLRVYWCIRNSQANRSVPISEWRFCFRILRFCFRIAFLFQNAVSVSEFCVLVSECRFNFRMRFLFQNIAFLFQNAVYVSEFCVSLSELRWPLCATVRTTHFIRHVTKRRTQISEHCNLQ